MSRRRDHSTSNSLRKPVTAWLLVLGLALGGCSLLGYGDCGFEPIGASIRAPTFSPIDAHGVGACGRWVDIEGYYWNQSDHAFELDAEALEPIGQATAASDLVAPLAAPTVYSIPGVDAAEAVAMVTPDGSFLVFTRESSGPIPPELCPMLAPTEHPAAGGCDQGEGPWRPFGGLA